MSDLKQIESNIEIHDRIAAKYERIHPEIFNEVEQDRLHKSLKNALSFVDNTSGLIKVLDFGCGSGNLTSHLLRLNTEVTAADVSDRFLQLVKRKYPSDQLKTFKLNGVDLEGLPKAHFDFIALYSVLHHIPDYVGLLKDLASLCKPGGVIYIDHENNDEFWSNTSRYNEFRRKASKFNWHKYLDPFNYVHKIRRFFNPRHTNEGDIHVWPDDHIEWNAIEQLFDQLQFQVVVKNDYLLCNKLYRQEIYNEYKDKCSDTRVMAFRKTSHH